MLLERRIYKYSDNRVAWRVSDTSQSISQHITFARVTSPYQHQMCLNYICVCSRDITVGMNALSATFVPGEHRALHVWRIFTQERRRSHVGRWLLLASSGAVWPWLAVVSLAFQGPRPRLLLHRARAMAYPTPDANKAHHSLPLLFACLPGHTTPPFTTYRHILHCIHYSPRLYIHYTRLAIFLSAAPPTLIKCLQTPPSHYEQLLRRRKEARHPP